MNKIFLSLARLLQTVRRITKMVGQTIVINRKNTASQIRKAKEEDFARKGIQTRSRLSAEVEEMCQEVADIKTMKVGIMKLAEIGVEVALAEVYI